MLVRFQEVSKSFGEFEVLRHVSFQIHPGEKVGLIGENGAGKTTLLSLISGSESPDSGGIVKGTNLQTRQLAQTPTFSEQTTVLEAALQPFDRLRQTENELREIEHAISIQPKSADLLERYSKLQHEFEFSGGYSYQAQTKSALQGLGFSSEQFGQQANSLSGGEKNWLALARLLLSDATLLLLDEPTNHLDIRSIEWLEHYLMGIHKAVLMVSHDRFFLDRTVNRIMELRRGSLATYKGNYSAYLRQQTERAERHRKQWEQQQKWIKRTEEYIRRNLAGQKTRQAQARRKSLGKIQRIESPGNQAKAVEFRFHSKETVGRYVINASNLQTGHPGKMLLADLNINIERGDRWALVGPNGSGKTTLLRSLTGSLPVLAGELTRDENLKIGYYDQELQNLDPSHSILDELRNLDSRATDGEIRSFLAHFLFRGEEIFKLIADLSGGEKSRLSLAKIIYAGPPVLALDEPTNHLDIASREALEVALAQYPGTMLFVSHDRHLVRSVANHILYLDKGTAIQFDQFASFEQWLADSIDVKTKRKEKTANIANKTARAMSKNKREQLMREIYELETRIEATEKEVAAIEVLFQEATADFDWAKTNQQYAKLKSILDETYAELAEKWKISD